MQIKMILLNRDYDIPLYKGAKKLWTELNPSAEI